GRGRDKWTALLSPYRGRLESDGRRHRVFRRPSMADAPSWQHLEEAGHLRDPTRPAKPSLRAIEDDRGRIDDSDSGWEPFSLDPMPHDACKGNAGKSQEDCSVES